MQRISCWALLAVSSLLLQCPAFGQVEKRQPAISQRPLGYFSCDKRSNMCFLKAVEIAQNGPIKFNVKEIWKYNMQEEKWTYVLPPLTRDIVIAPTAGQVHGGNADFTVQAITDSVGLFWVKWTENDMPVEKFLYSGMLCNDVNIGPKRKGDLIAACVPGKDQATAAYVPDPKIYCVRK